MSSPRLIDIDTAMGLINVRGDVAMKGSASSDIANANAITSTSRRSERRTSGLLLNRKSTRHARGSSEKVSMVSSRRRLGPALYEASAALASFRASIALTLLTNAFSKERLAMVPSKPERIRPFKFLPWRTMRTSTSVVPLGCRFNL